MSYHKKASNNINNIDNNIDSFSKNRAGRKRKHSVRFSNNYIENLKPLKKTKLYWFEGYKGFGIRVMPSGTKKWVVQYPSKGKFRRITIGKYSDISISNARQLYANLMTDVEFGIDPLEQKALKKSRDKDDITVSKLLELYRTHSKQTGKKTYDRECKQISNGLGSKILNKRISQVTPREISEIVRGKVNNGTPVAAEHLLKYTKRLFNYGAGLLLLKQNNNPCIGIKLNLPKKRRQRYLSPKEIYMFWHNLEQFPVSPVLKLSLKLLLCTACRSIEVRTMKWDDIDLVNCIWTMPTSKNGRMHRVFLSSLAISIIEEVRLYTSGCEWVFGCNKYNGRSQIIDNVYEPFKVWTLSQVFRRHFDKFGIKQEFYPHDLRRTGATMIAGLFGRRDFASMVLNHTTSDVTGIYDLYTYDNEKKVALEALNKAIYLIINSPNVESVPSFDEIRSRIIKPSYQVNFLRDDFEIDKPMDLSTNFPNHVSYKLSYDHDGLKKQV